MYVCFGTRVVSFKALFSPIRRRIEAKKKKKKNGLGLAQRNDCRVGLRDLNAFFECLRSRVSGYDEMSMVRRVLRYGGAQTIVVFRRRSQFWVLKTSLQN